jgi:hypothetical protein
MIALILQLGFWVNTSGEGKQVICPIHYEMEQRLPQNCVVIHQGILYTIPHYIEEKAMIAELGASKNALQEKNKFMQAELILAQEKLTTCITAPQQIEIKTPLLIGFLVGALTSGAFLLWNN